MTTQRELQIAYGELHAACPQCGSNEVESTTMGFVFSDLETAEDRNRAWCHSCDWRGIVHQMVEGVAKWKT